MNAFRSRPIWHAASWVLLLGVMLLACRPARRSEPILGPLQITDARVAAGERHFHRHCHSCHPGGEAGLGPSLNDKSLPTWLIRFQVRRGMGVMPSFSREQISPSELDDLLRYMLALRRHRGASGVDD